jgi:hypothetical protein
MAKGHLLAGPIEQLFPLGRRRGVWSGEGNHTDQWHIEGLEQSKNPLHRWRKTEAAEHGASEARPKVRCVIVQCAFHAAAVRLVELRQARSKVGNHVSTAQ